jgi:hypothetical protein
MKITITYEHDSAYSEDNCYFAQAEVFGHRFVECGPNFDKAREKLVSKLVLHIKNGIDTREPEEIEVS